MSNQYKSGQTVAIWAFLWRWTTKGQQRHAASRSSLGKKKKGLQGTSRMSVLGRCNNCGLSFPGPENDNRRMMDGSYPTVNDFVAEHAVTVAIVSRTVRGWHYRPLRSAVSGN